MTLMDLYLRRGKYGQTSPRGRQNNNTRNDSGNGRSRYTNSRGHNPIHQRNPPEMSRPHVSADARNFQPRLSTPHFTLQTPTTGIRQGPGPTGVPHVNNQLHTSPYGQHSRNPRRRGDGACAVPALSIAQVNRMPDSAEALAKTTRIVFHEFRRGARLFQSSYADPLTGTNPPDNTLIQRCGRPHDRGLDNQGPSDISASFSDSSDGHGHPTPLPCPAQTGVCPQSRPTFPPKTTVVRVTQGRTATVAVAVIPPRSLDAENAFYEGK